MPAQCHENVKFFKALSDVNRLMILDMLSCGELCACMLLEKLNINQSTLSHHMKILCDCSLVNARKDGKWMHYTLNAKVINSLKNFLNLITSNKDHCICMAKDAAKHCKSF